MRWLAALALASCGPGVASAPSEPLPPAGTSAPSSAPAARGADGVDSPVVLAIEEEGLVTLGADGAHPLFATKKGLVGLAITTDGAVFASFYDEGTLLFQNGSAKRTGEQRFDHFIAWSATDAWGITQEIDWQVQRFDGERWIAEKTRADFHGVFSDNKLNDVAREANGDLWVSSVNALWRRDAVGWWPVAPPEAAGKLGGPTAAPDQLFATPDGLVARFGARCFRRDREGWRAADCPGTLGVRGLPRSARDGRGRTWSATDLGLNVADDRGTKLATYPPGTLEGVRGPIVAIAIAGNGLGRLPTPGLPGAWKITGRIEIYKNSKPLDGIRVKLCAGRAGCQSGEPLQKAVTASDGSFEFAGIPDGVYDLEPVIPEGLEACEGPFTSTPGATVTTPRGCDAITRTCALGTLRACEPFEMPPPPR